LRRIAARASPDDRFCRQCDSVEKIEGEFCEKCGAPAPEPWRKLCDCIEEVDSRFCGKCGGP
jgi:hypothetical protein